MSSYSKCRFCGNVDYPDFHEPRMCRQCSISYLAGQEDAEERIIKLLEDEELNMLRLPAPDALKMYSAIHHAIRLVKGEIK